MYSYPTRLSGRCRKLLRLRVARAQHDNVLWINPYALAAASFNQPSELHDRATRSVKDQLLDVAGISLDLIALSTDDGYLCRGSHTPCELTPHRAHARPNAPTLAR